jgi:hypothetical protein
MIYFVVAFFSHGHGRHAVELLFDLSTRHGCASSPDERLAMMTISIIFDLVFWQLVRHGTKAVLATLSTTLMSFNRN